MKLNKLRIKEASSGYPCAGYPKRSMYNCVLLIKETFYTDKIRTALYFQYCFNLV